MPVGALEDGSAPLRPHPRDCPRVLHTAATAEADLRPLRPCPLVPRRADHSPTRKRGLRGLLPHQWDRCVLLLRARRRGVGGEATSANEAMVPSGGDTVSVDKAVRRLPYFCR